MVAEVTTAEVLQLARQAVLDKRLIRIIRVHDEQITPFFITPAVSDKLRDFELGSEYDSLEKSNLTWMKKVHNEAKELFLDKENKEITHSIPVEHLNTFDCSRVRDAAIFLVLSTTDKLAKNKISVNPDYHFFYIEDKEAEASQFISKLDMKRKAWSEIDKIPVDELSAYFRLVKTTDPSNLSKTVMMSALQEEADKNPEQVYRVFNDQQLSYKLLVQKLVMNRTINYNRHDKVYRSGEMTLGTTLDEVVDFLLREENVALKDQWAATTVK